MFRQSHLSPIGVGLAIAFVAGSLEDGLFALIWNRNGIDGDE